jgi:hypothetical protein
MPFDQTRHEAVQSAATRSHKLQDVLAVSVSLQCAFNGFDLPLMRRIRLSRFFKSLVV